MEDLWSALGLLVLALLAVWVYFWPHTVPAWIQFIFSGEEDKEPEEEEV